jgi:tetratricopeptide (TPR) repeat protein
MNRNQGLFIGASILLILILAFVFRTSSPEQDRIQQMRSSTGSNISIANIERKAFATLDPAQKEEMRLLYRDLNESDSVNLKLFEQIAGKWFNFAAPEMSGVYAEKIAKEKDTAESWAIAGTTFYLAVSKQKEERIQEYCLDKAKSCLDNAISLEPENIDYKISRAQIEVDHPPQDNPMKGIQLLLELNRNYPDNAAIELRLAKLGMRTGQWSKAEERLKKVEAINPTKEVYCLLAEVYSNLENTDQFEQYSELCDEE